VGAEERLVDGVRLHSESLGDLRHVESVPPSENNSLTLARREILDETLEIEIRLHLIECVRIGCLIVGKLIGLQSPLLVMIEKRPSCPLVNDDAKRNGEPLAATKLAQQMLDHALSDFLRLVKRQSPRSKAKEDRRVVSGEKRGVIAGLNEANVLLIARSPIGYRSGLLFHVPILRGVDPTTGSSRSHTRGSRSSEA
jgi:hypothetical protein